MLKAYRLKSSFLFRIISEKRTLADEFAVLVRSKSLNHNVIMIGILLSLLFLPSIALADFVAGAGFELSKLETEEKATNDEPLLSVPTLVGFKGEIDYGTPWFTFFGSFSFNSGLAKTQYDYTNPDNPAETAAVEDLRARANLSRLSLGARLRLIKLKSFRVFIGGGYQFGLMSLTYDKEDFKDKNGSTTGFEENERQSIKGIFGEAGMDFIIDNDSGIRLVAQKSNLSSPQFKTLDDKKLKLDTMSASISYIQYVETGNW